jgi:hypothetical protein
MNISPFTQLILAMVGCTFILRYGLHRVEKQLKRVPIRVRKKERKRRNE